MENRKLIITKIFNLLVPKIELNTLEEVRFYSNLVYVIQCLGFPLGFDFKWYFYYVHSPGLTDVLFDIEKNWFAYIEQASKVMFRHDLFNKIQDFICFVRRKFIKEGKIKYLSFNRFTIALFTINEDCFKSGINYVRLQERLSTTMPKTIKTVKKLYRSGVISKPDESGTP